MMTRAPVARGGYVTAHTIVLARFLADRVGRIAAGDDANLRTHTRLRCTGLRGTAVHRLDSARGRCFYTTACGLRVPKTAGTLTAAAVDCRHHGCRPRE